ncbi:MAG: hypothetical protein K2I10_05185 [Lachnospiraceae bacterium]|nr:hypothetical protein [Lachnospiraceae bacterium]
MTNDDTNPIKIIEESNSKTLDYFNKTYVHNLELVQSLKTELFELKVQIETLEKTKDLYTYNTDNRRSVFSPIANEQNTSITKGKQIALQIKDLQDVKGSLENRIADLEQDIIFYKEQVEMLSKAGKCIHTILTEKNHSDDDILEEGNAIEYIETEDVESKAKHAYKMMMLEDYSCYNFARQLDQTVKQELISNLNKLDVLKWLLHSDLGRAKVTLSELHNSSQNVLESLDIVLEQLNYTIDAKQSILEQVEKLIDGFRKKHSECIIEATCDCTEHELNLPSVITIRLLRMLREVFDNIFKHSNANMVTAKIFISNRLIDVFVSDNGVGIPEDYLDRSDWHSGLHRLHETIYQLDGKLDIQGDLISGTSIRFSFPIKK